MRFLLVAALAATCLSAHGQECFRTSVTAPHPLMGNHGEIFRTADGGMYEVVGSYEYLYAYSPSVTICPSRAKMLIEGKTVGIMALRTLPRMEKRSGAKVKNSSGQRPVHSSDTPITIVLRVRGCDYFVADGPHGHYLLQHSGGYDPEYGDGIFGELNGYGFKDVLYTRARDGKVYVDNYLLSKDRAMEKLAEKCAQ